MENLFASEFPVPEGKVTFYRENGYVQFDNVLNQEELDLVRAGLEKARAERKGIARDLAGKGEKEKILQMLNLWEHHDEIKQYVFGGRIAGIAKKLTGSSEIHLYHDQALVKEPGPSAPSPWHQDQPYWPSREGGMLSCWMALDPVTIDRGCMQFIPGSHKWGELPPISFTGDGPELQDYLTEEQKALWNPVPVELSPGSCTFHHGLTYHFAGPNTTDMTRRAFIMIMIPDGITYAAEDKMDNPFSDSITSQKGEPLRGNRFPRLGSV